ncbi:MAG: peptidoglycan-binding protein [Candidatus Binatia bacterium]
MKTLELALEPRELFPEFEAFEEDDESLSDEFEAADDGLFEDADNEIRRFRSAASRRTPFSRSRFAARLPRRRALRPRFSRRPRRRRPQPPWRVKPRYRRRIIARDLAPDSRPAQSTEYVRWLQSSLNQILGLNLPVDGLMNPATREALRRFQQQQGLPPDGIAGPETERALIAASSSGATDAKAGTAEPAQSELFEFEDEELEAPLVRPTLRRGSRGPSVVELQRRLTTLGFASGAADGIFGSRTEAAVKAFQRSRRIGVDGIVGPQTWNQLYGRSPTPTPSPTPAPGPSSPTWALPSDVRAAGDAQTVRYDSPPPWANGANCTSYTDGAADLRRHILASFPGVDRIGGYNCRANSATPSETSVHGVGRALDIMIQPVGGRANSASGDPIANWLVRNARAIGVQYIIWNRVRWSGSRTPRVASYGGPNPHTDHIHVELNLDGARRSTPWFSQ